MVNTIPARTQLGASTTNRKWYLDVYNPQGGAIVPVMGIGEYKPKPSEPTLQTDSDFDGGGFTSSTVTAQSWGGEGKLHRKTLTSSSTAYDPGQEILRKAAKKMGAGNSVKVRIYEMEPNGPRVEAYEGFVAVGWTPDGGDMTATDTVSFTLTGQGAPVDIIHPEGAVAVPVISSVTPSGAITGDSVVIKGAYFTGTTGVTGVKFGAVNATSYTVVDDQTILAKVPAGAAGQVTVTVGATVSSFLYTRGA